MKNLSKYAGLLALSATIGCGHPIYRVDTRIDIGNPQKKAIYHNVYTKDSNDEQLDIACVGNDLCRMLVDNLQETPEWFLRVNELFSKKEYNRIFSINGDEGFPVISIERTSEEAKEFQRSYDSLKPVLR